MLTAVETGYWMPFDCARAVCATFCFHMAGALIPIFGPRFPSECIPPDAPEHGRMIINPLIIAQAARDADGYRHSSTVSCGPKPLPNRPQHYQAPNNASNPTSMQHYRPPASQPPTPDIDRSRLCYGSHHPPDSPYTTDTDNELGFNRQYQYSRAPGHIRSMHPNHGWTSADAPMPGLSHYYTDHFGASPFLSAVPRFAPGPPQHHRQYQRLPPMQPHSSDPWHGGGPQAQHLLPQGKRPAPDIDSDTEYDAGESTNGNSPETALRGVEDHVRAPQMPSGDAEKNAALMLMNLNFQEKKSRPVSTCAVESGAGEVHRSKRRRSM
jgi:hypothetical protein